MVLTESRCASMLARRSIRDCRRSNVTSPGSREGVELQRLSRIVIHHERVEARAENPRRLSDADFLPLLDRPADGDITQSAGHRSALPSHDRTDRWQIVARRRHGQSRHRKIPRVGSGHQHVNRRAMIPQSLRIDSHRSDQREVLSLVRQHRQHLAQHHPRSTGRDGTELASNLRRAQRALDPTGRYGSAILANRRG